MGKRSSAVLCGAMAVALIAAGCGSSSSSPTKAEFIKEANAVCAEARKKISTDTQAHVAEEDVRKMSGFTELAEEYVLPVLRREASELRALTPPAGDEAEVTAIANGIDEGVDEAEKDIGALISRTSGALTEANLAADRYGLEGCGRV